MKTIYNGTESHKDKVTAIIVAAGAGVRMGGLDKLFTELGGMPLLARTIAAFEECPLIDEIILVSSEANLERCWKLIRSQGLKKVTELVPGGARRQGWHAPTPLSSACPMDTTRTSASAAAACPKDSGS